MSQEKVTRYKEEKANRRKNMKKAKAKNVCRKIAGTVVALALIAFVGISAYQKYDDNKGRDAVTVDYSAISDYASALDGEAE